MGPSSRQSCATNRRCANRFNRHNRYDRTLVPRDVKPTRSAREKAAAIDPRLIPPTDSARRASDHAQRFVQRSGSAVRAARGHKTLNKQNARTKRLTPVDQTASTNPLDHVVMPALACSQTLAAAASSRGFSVRSETSRLRCRSCNCL